MQIIRHDKLSKFTFLCIMNLTAKLTFCKLSLICCIFLVQTKYSIQPFVFRPTVILNFVWSNPEFDLSITILSFKCRLNIHIQEFHTNNLVMTLWFLTLVFFYTKWAKMHFDSVLRSICTKLDKLVIICNSHSFPDKSVIHNCIMVMIYITSHTFMAIFYLYRWSKSINICDA